MAKLNKADQDMLQAIADLHETPQGAYNIRKNGEGLMRHSTANITITPKENVAGIDIHIAPFTKNESVHIPVLLMQTGMSDLVYNDFYIGEGADVLIVAGCGIHNTGSEKAQHDGIHRFHIGKNAHIRYVEKHYGEGEGTGERILNPVTEVFQEEGSVCEMELIQIAGIDSTVRETTATLAKDAKMISTERLLTHGKQHARSNMTLVLNGENSSGQIINRSVAKHDSEQVFYLSTVGNNACRAHIQCDSIIMDNAHVSSIPQIDANHCDAAMIHEAAIGRINSDQLLKLMSFGIGQEEAEEIIIQGFLK